MLKKNCLALLMVFCAICYKMPAAIEKPGPAIVFIHIGQELPIYLQCAVQQARLFNSCEIIVVANQEAIEKQREGYVESEVVFISCESLTKTASHQKFWKMSLLDKVARGGFWNHATERFFYLQDLICLYNLSHVVHLESDNMLYVDIQELMPILQKKYRGIAATFDNEERCIPGFIYIPNSSSINHLAAFMVKQASRKMNDMESLGRYRKVYGNKYVKPLPVIMKSYVEKNEMVSPTKQKAINKYAFCKYDKDFHSLFDAAAIGQFLGGIDPRNGPSMPGFINESCLFNPALLQYEWIEDDKGRDVPYASYAGQSYRLNNLHIHSKNLNLFLSK